MRQGEASRARLALIASMCIFGTIGILRRFLPVPSGFLAMLRGLLGTLFLLLLTRFRGEKPDRAAIRANRARLCISGALIGVNWIFMFEAYRYTTVATATLCYYMAPVFTLLGAPFVLRERMTLRKGVCVAVALVGMALVSGMTQSGFTVAAAEWRGVALALAAAVIYAAVVLINKRVHDIGAYDKTIVQIGTAGAVLIPYVLLTEELASIAFTPRVIALLLVAGVVHTGCAYALYFSSTDALPAHTLALLSYLDPVIAVALSALLLHEPMTAAEVLGALLILCAAIVAELPERSRT